MGELFDKEGNAISEVFDSEGNPIDETLTPEEVETKIGEAKDEAQGDFDTKAQKLQEEKDKAVEDLKSAQEALEKELEKDKNFGRLNKKTDEKEKEVQELTTKVSNLTEKLTALETITKAQPVKAMIKKLAGNDTELEKKIKFHFDSFTTPEDDDEEKQKERLTNAYTLATGAKPKNPLTGEVVSSAGGVAPGGDEPGDEGKISKGAENVAHNLGISDKELKQSKLK